MELWDALDAQGNKLGFDLVRGEPVPEGCYHAVAEVAVKHADGDVLITLRDASKQTWPNCWELGAGGSVLKDESPQDGAMRELREETGIIADQLTPLFVLARADNHCIYYSYLCRYSGPKDAIALQPGETAGYRWLTPDGLREMADDPQFVGSHRQRWQAFIQHAEEY